MPTKVCLVKAIVFPVVMYGCELDYKESWAPKNWCFWTVVLEKTLENPLDCKEIQPKGDQSWVFIGRTDVETETPILWPPDEKNWLIWIDLVLGKIEGGRRREWDGWMASVTQWMWVWVNSGSWWWTRRPDMLQSMGSQGVGRNWVIELNWTGFNQVSDIIFIYLYDNSKASYLWLFGFKTSLFLEQSQCRIYFDRILLLSFLLSLDLGIYKAKNRILY